MRFEYVCKGGFNNCIMMVINKNKLLPKGRSQKHALYCVNQTVKTWSDCYLIVIIFDIIVIIDMVRYNPYCYISYML